MILIFKRSWTFRSNSMQICGNCGILHPLGIREGLINRSPVLKIDVAWWWSLLRAAPQSFPPPKYVRSMEAYFFRCANHFRLIFWRPGDLIFLDVFFWRGGMYTQKMHLFIQVTTHLNSILSLWISWWANAPRLNTKSTRYCTVNLSWWRDQIKKRQTCTDSSLLKKKTGPKTPKKNLPETLKRQRSKIDLIWTPGCKSLILLMQISQSQWNIAQDIDLAYDTRMDIGEFDLLEILY